MSEQDPTQATPPAEGAPAAGEPGGQPQQAAPAAPAPGGPGGGAPVGDAGGAAPVDLNAETAQERQARKLQGYQDDQERLRREHGQT